MSLKSHASDDIARWLMVPRGCAVLYVPAANHRLIQTTFPTSSGYEALATRELMKSSDDFLFAFS